MFWYAGKKKLVTYNIMPRSKVKIVGKTPKATMRRKTKTARDIRCRIRVVETFPDGNSTLILICA